MESKTSSGQAWFANLHLPLNVISKDWKERYENKIYFYSETLS